MNRPVLAAVVAVAVVGAIGAIVGTIWVGSKVREDTVVAHPYQDGLRQEADRAARARLRWDVRLEPTGAPGVIAFSLLDGEGRPLQDAEVEVSAGRPDTSRGVVRAKAAPAGGGRWIAPLDLPGDGEWLLGFDVRRGEDRLRLERTGRVAPPCLLSAGPCTRALPGEPAAEVTLELGPRPLRTMAELAAVATVRSGGAPVDGAAVRVALSMPGMAMGENVAVLARDAPGRYQGRVTVVRCMSGRKDWEAEVSVASAGAPARSVRFPFTVSE
jgi:nitrogen fixation protein FixH